MNPRWQEEYNEWMDEVSASKDINGEKDSLGGCWSPVSAASYIDNLIRYLCSVFPIKNVLDVGSGAGQILRNFRMYGCQVIGIEPLKSAAKHSDVPVIVHNLEVSPIILQNIDLCVSIECFEHIVPEKEDNVFDTYCCAKMVVMSHALPFQPGHHHKNCRDEEYIINKMISRKYRYLEEMSILARKMDCTYFSNTGKIFLHDSVDWGTKIGNYKEIP